MKPVNGDPDDVAHVDEEFGSCVRSQELMRRRIGNILLVASLYDSFVLEEDGQLGDQILSDYVDLQLRYAPRLTRASTAEKALAMMRYRRFDMVLTMTRLPDMDVFDFCRKIKARHLGTPVVLLAYETEELPGLLAVADRSAVDHVLVWSGDSRILLATVKLVEDRWNVDHDVQYGGVRTILVVAESARRVSAVLPVLYTEMMTQTREVMDEALSYKDRLLCMRGRPKLLLARDFEDAQSLFERYCGHMLAVVCDACFAREGTPDPDAGLALTRWIRSRDRELPLLILSASSDAPDIAGEPAVVLVDRHSPTWPRDVDDFFVSHLGFGDFVFRADDGSEVGRASSIREMQEKILEIPDEAVTYHLSRTHLSTWLVARGEHALATELRARSLDEFECTGAARRYVAERLRSHRVQQRRGLISEFRRDEVDPASPFVRIAGGSLGGKGRGVAFFASLLPRLDLKQKFPGVRVVVPQTFALGTDAFTRFLDANNLEKAAIQSQDDAEVERAFQAGSLPRDLEDDLRGLLEAVRYPLAVRSSSLLEDSLLMPFAGLYATFMIPNNHPDIEVRLLQLVDAIKQVYASTFFQAPKSYIRGSPYRIEEERMGIIIQRLVANRHENVCYPSFAGVAQSYNSYPIGRMRAEDGLAHVALGLGKMVMDGGRVLRFSPARPQIPPGFSSPRDILRNSQRSFYALDLSRPAVPIDPGGEGPLVKLDLQDAERHGTLAPVGSVHIRADDVCRSGVGSSGTRLITFTQILRTNLFPLAPILRELLSVGRQAMGYEVEIEFAAKLDNREGGQHEFSVVQCRPTVAGSEEEATCIEDIDETRALCLTQRSLGNGRIGDIRDVVFVTPDRWDASRTYDIAREVSRINTEIQQEGRRFVLIGLGRWGTSEPSQGIPVKWNDISGAGVIVEVGWSGYTVVPSQGSHFFHNITSLRIGYLTIDTASASGRMEWSALDAARILTDLRYVRRVQFPAPLDIRLDGRTGRGAILLPKLTG